MRKNRNQEGPKLINCARDICLAVFLIDEGMGEEPERYCDLEAGHPGAHQNVLQWRYPVKEGPCPITITIKGKVYHCTRNNGHDGPCETILQWEDHAQKET